MEFPVHEELDVIDGTTISKNEDWWKAVVVCDGYYGPEVNVYLWQHDDDENDKWRRKQKMKIRSNSEWSELKDAIDELVDEHLKDDD